MARRQGGVAVMGTQPPVNHPRGVRPAAHGPRKAVNAAQPKIMNYIKHDENFFCGYEVFNVWPKYTTRSDTPDSIPL